MRRRDFIVEYVFEKDFIEDVMKSIAWATLCGAIYAFSMSSFSNGNVVLSFFVFVFFIFSSVMSLFYVAMYIVIPLDSTMYPGDPYWDDKAEQLSGLSRFWEVLKIFITRKGIFYLFLCMGYFMYANAVAKYLAFIHA